MNRITYVNGRYTVRGEACVHVEDRGYQLADGVYEVISVTAGRQVDARAHLLRLQRSLGELRIPTPMSLRALALVIAEVIRRNRVRNGWVYLQVTRGVAPREHAFPANNITPALVVYACARPPGARAARWRDGVRVVVTPDLRWARRDIKSISLLPNCLAKQEAREADAHEALLVAGDGMITEGSSSNAWIIDRDGRLVTRPADHGILNGVTRLALMALAAREGLSVEERPFSESELKDAREVFLTGSSDFVTPVIQVDDRVIGNGRPGSVTERIIAMFEDYLGGEQIDAAAGQAGA